MPQVKFNGAVSINLTGYDREAVTLEAGVHDVPERIAEWVRRNPSIGDVLDAAAASAHAAVGVDFSRLTVAELRAAAEAAGIAGFAGMKKAELVAALETAEVPAGDGEADGAHEGDDEDAEAHEVAEGDEAEGEE